MCKTKKKLSEDNFHLVKGKFISACKVCRNKNKPLHAKQRRERLAALGIKEHIEQYKKHKESILAYHKQPEVVERRNNLRKAKYAENPAHYNVPKREYKQKNKERINELQREKDRRRIERLDDSYVALLIYNRLNIPIAEARKNKVLMETYRTLIKLKRLINYNNKR